LAGGNAHELAVMVVKAAICMPGAIATCQRGYEYHACEIFNAIDNKHPDDIVMLLDVHNLLTEAMKNHIQLRPVSSRESKRKVDAITNGNHLEKIIEILSFLANHTSVTK
jgi:hypothetical protein